MEGNLKAFIITIDNFLVDKFSNLPFGNDCIIHVQPPVFPLDGYVSFYSLTQPIVRRPTILELFGAQRVSDIFDGITQAMSKVVCWVNAPLVASSGMRCEPDSVNKFLVFRELVESLKIL